MHRPETLILLLLAIAAGYLWWNAARMAAERATQLGRDACRAAGVIWLDHTVHAAGLRLRRREDGWLGLERSFRFEYSVDGTDRHAGRLVLFSDRLVEFSGPPRAAAAVVPMPSQRPRAE